MLIVASATPAMTKDVNNDRFSDHCRIVDEHIAFENTHDLDGIMSTFGTAVHYVDEPWGEHHVGRSEVRAFSRIPSF